MEITATHYPKMPKKCSRIDSIDEVKMMNDRTWKMIDDILARGNDAKVRRKGNGYVVVEVKETIKYNPPPIVEGEGQ